ncbi:putative mRNA-binding protein CTH1 NDAI_0J00950 [Naumovozyma dairenensis CBS 421]|uniref:C3H1-type domain-containing protein n=1 Tax=Naumovozyma dairenensis (strain ATCC 10597 / BCRC 20456 / CBS 421 / NBRC 0211 / NRRL Y-12639) TaxID=1071378 RepID=G0WGQ9_NAUDC|nr:hypothetical protein NDAI_0J00950 [Naumovozyma dairenensis CBS 421]CCD26987.1 hypothetical protein NDAI_0J00950 [Naumovozyma dairenensis CBS 421]
MLYSDINNHYLTTNQKQQSTNRVQEPELERRNQQTPSTFQQPNYNVLSDTTTSHNNLSAYPNMEEGYDSKLKEIEDYYTKTLLNDNEEDINAYSAQLNENNRSATGNESNSFHLHYPQQRQVDHRNMIKMESISSPAPLQTSGSSSLFKSFLTTNNQESIYHPLQHTKPLHDKKLEVEINSNFVPVSSTTSTNLSSTTEHLQKLSITQPPSSSIFNQQLLKPTTTPLYAENNMDSMHSDIDMTNLLPQSTKPLSSSLSRTTVSLSPPPSSQILSPYQQQQQQINKQLYKTELCESFTTKGTCKYGNKCQFAHGLHELKLKQRSNNFRTKPCVNWAKLGYCPYGKRCCFKHGDDRDIQLYVKAGALVSNMNTNSSNDENDESTRSSSMQQNTSYYKPKNLHASVKELQRITW